MAIDLRCPVCARYHRANPCPCGYDYETRSGTVAYDRAESSAARTANVARAGLWVVLLSPLVAAFGPVFWLTLVSGALIAGRATYVVSRAERRMQAVRDLGQLPEATVLRLPAARIL